MITTHNQIAQEGKAHEDASKSSKDLSPTDNSIKALILPPSLQMHYPIVTHHPRAGLNPMVDAAGYLFTIMGELSNTKHFKHLAKLHKELIHEINTFEQAVNAHHYNGEYIQVCRYVICAVIDELISNTEWGRNGQWEPYSLLTAYDLDKNHHEQFFSILEYSIKEPAYYIDLMELMYICLSIGYNGGHHKSEHDQQQLEQITNSLYKYIRSYRGNASKLLSPAPIKAPRPAVPQVTHEPTSPWTVILITACIIVTLFISLGYLMEMISNEAIRNFADIQKTVSRNNLG